MHIEGLDEFDNKIIEILKDNARLSYSEIGEQIGISRVSVRKRMEALDKGIDQFHLSDYAYQRLAACGIHQVRDLYATNPKNEPGWYAVRELFEKIMKGS